MNGAQLEQGAEPPRTKLCGYEKFEAFIKEQRDFNKKIESHIASNSVEISECTIELKDLEHKCKNQTKEVKLFCGNHIQAVKDENR